MTVSKSDKMKVKSKGYKYTEIKIISITAPVTGPKT